MQDTYVVDGSFYCGKTYGIQRFAREIMAILDKDPAASKKLTVLVPAYYHGEVPLENIPVVRFGTHRGKLWRQIDLARYLWTHHAQGLFMENLITLFYRHGIVVLHDIIFRARPDFFLTSMKKYRTILFWRLVYRRIMTSGMKIVTVSKFTKDEILKYYRVSADRIMVAGNGWEHMSRVVPEMVPDGLIPGTHDRPYLFAVASASTKHKNLAWFFRAARANPGLTFVVAGGMSPEDIEGHPGNVIFPGYLSDGQIKLLMSRCMAFVFPSCYEGFGIPPLEAAASGAPRLILSDIPVLHEVYGDHAQYIDPDGNGEELASYLASAPADLSGLLEKYSWKNTAAAILELLNQPSPSEY